MRLCCRDNEGKVPFKWVEDLLEISEMDLLSAVGPERQAKSVIAVALIPTSGWY